MSFNPNRPVQFRHGPAKVRILATDLQSELPVVIAVLRDDGIEEIRGRYASGRVKFDREGPYDLVNVPIKHEVWINFYNDEEGYDSSSYPSQAIANESADSTRIACIRVEFTEGEGL